MASEQVKPTVLCLFTSERSKIILSSEVFRSDFYQLISIPSELDGCHIKGRYDYLKAAEICSKAVEQHSIDAVMALDNDSSPLLPVLVEKHGRKNIRGPSFESFFLTFNKFYTRKFLDPNPIPYAHIDLNRHLRGTDLDNLVKEVGFPAILKPQTATSSILVQKVTTISELIEAIQYSREHYHSMVGNTIPILADHLDVNKFPLALTDGMILEKYVDGKIFDIDGYVFNGKTYHWALYDMITWPCNPSATQMLLLPCMLNDQVQEKLWSVFNSVADRLVQHGFDNQFINIQLFLCKNGEVRLLEVNGRMSTVCVPMCQKSLSPGDTIQAQLNVALGQQPQEPRFTGVHSAFVEIRVTVSGKADEIIDFTAAETMDNLELYVTRDEYIQPVGDGGKECGVAYLIGDSREQIMRKHSELYQNLFRKHPMGC